VAWHPGLYGFQTCGVCHEVSHWELFANIPSLPFVLLTVFFQSLPKIHDHRWGSAQRPIEKLKALRSLKAPVLSPWSNKAHAESRLLYQSAYQSRLSTLVNTTPRYLKISTCCSVLYFCSLAENTALGVLRHNTSIFSEMIFVPAWSHTAETDQMRAEDLVEKIHTCSTNSSAKRKRFTLQFPTVIRLSTRLWLSIPGVYNLLLLPAAWISFIWSTAANEKNGHHLNLNNFWNN